MADPASAAGGHGPTRGDAVLLSGEVGGPVLLPGDDGYEDECAAYNLALARRPAMVVGATSPGDVASAVRLAARLDLPVGVLATGHGSSLLAGVVGYTTGGGARSLAGTPPSRSTA